MVLNALLVLVLLPLGSGAQAISTDAAEQTSQCPTDDSSKTCKMKTMSLMQIKGSLDRKSANLDSREDEEEVEAECAPEDKNCSKTVEVKLPPAVVTIGCCKDCPCNSTPPPPVFRMQPPQKFGVCYSHGDPHITTFDGAKVGSRASGTHWYVYSPKGVQIQGVWHDRGRARAIAFGGEWMKGHTVIVNVRGGDKFAMVDGKKYLTKDNERHSVEGVFELHRMSRGHLKLTEEQAKELDGGKTDGKWRRFLDKGWSKKSGMFHLKLPHFTEVWMTEADATEMIIKMPEQSDVGGWCGNFNGDPKDDTKGRDIRRESAAKGTMLDRVGEDLDWFKGTKFKASMVQEDEKDTPECPAELLAKAKKECEAIPEKSIHDDCVFDICLTGDVKIAEDAASIEILKMKVAQGLIEYEGHGRCLDQFGQLFTTVKATAVDDMQKCIDLMQVVANHNDFKKDLSKLRGAQFQNIGGGGSCFFLVEAGVDAPELMQGLPGLWGETSEKEGTGIISNTDSEKGFHCWNFIN